MIFIAIVVIMIICIVIVVIIVVVVVVLVMQGDRCRYSSRYGDACDAGHGKTCGNHCANGCDSYNGPASTSNMHVRKRKQVLGPMGLWKQNFALLEASLCDPGVKTLHAKGR